MTIQFQSGEYNIQATPEYLAKLFSTSRKNGLLCAYEYDWAAIAKSDAENL